MSQNELAEIERRYCNAENRPIEPGFVIAGIVGERYLTCGKANCRCKGRPVATTWPVHRVHPQTRRWDDRSQTQPRQAEQYREWIANRRTLGKILAEMDDLSHQAAILLARPAS